MSRSQLDHYTLVNKHLLTLRFLLHVVRHLFGNLLLVNGLLLLHCECLLDLGLPLSLGGAFLRLLE